MYRVYDSMTFFCTLYSSYMTICESDKNLISLIFHQSLTTAAINPFIHGWFYVKDFDKKLWNKKYIRMSDSSIYLCEDEYEMVCSFLVNVGRVDLVTKATSLVWINV